MEAKKRATKKQRWKAFEEKNHTEMKMQLQEPNQKKKTQTARRRLKSSQENFNNNIEKHVREPNALRIMFFINHNIFGSLVVYIGYLLLMM